MVLCNLSDASGSLSVQVRHYAIKVKSNIQSRGLRRVLRARVGGNMGAHPDMDSYIDKLAQQRMSSPLVSSVVSHLPHSFQV